MCAKFGLKLLSVCLLVTWPSRRWIGDPEYIAPEVYEIISGERLVLEDIKSWNNFVKLDSWLTNQVFSTDALCAAWIGLCALRNNINFPESFSLVLDPI